MKMTAKKQESGFTLVELLVSVVIVAVLSATAIPHYQEIRERAYKAERMSMIQNLITAFNARDDQDASVTELSGNDRRRIIRRHSGAFNGSQGGGTAKNLMLGISSEPAYFQLTTEERNPATASANAIVQRHIVDDCRNGYRRIWTRRNRGTVTVAEVYRATVDTRC